MKKILILIVLITIPLLTIGQNTASNTDTRQDKVKIETTDIITSETRTVLTTAAKAELDKMNYKKSNDLISIKAYRKSLQIKVKEIKIC